MFPTDLYRSVPKDIEKNLAYRESVRRQCQRDETARRDYIAACAKDVLFWVNTFCWLYEPRASREFAFVTWDVQDRLFVTLMENYGKRDVLVLKSRDMGATWCDLTLDYWLWRFKRMVSLMVCSRKEALVDMAGEPDTLFSKLDFIHATQPWWMRPRRNRLQMMMENPDASNTMTGSSTTGDIGRGGRKTKMTFDEFAAFSVRNGIEANAASLKTSRNRVFISTPNGSVGEFFEMWHKKTDAIVKFRMHWSDHPVMRAGMYTSEDGVLKIVDEPYWAERPVERSKYPFRLDGKLRSPEYDYYCDKATTAQQIAEQLDCDFIGSGAAFYESAMLNRVQTMFARDEECVGDLLYDGADLAAEKKFLPSVQGRLRLWFPVGEFNTAPPPSKYIIGADISSGTGASNTCISVVDERTGEQVAELCSPNLRPVDAARYAVALAWWFADSDGSGARLIWEGNGGPGRNFGDAVSKDFHYRNIYYQKSERKLVPTETENPGWWSTRENKIALLTELGEAMNSGLLAPRSREFYGECREYQYTDDGGVDHIRATSIPDPSGAGQNHGDRVIALALARRMMKAPPRPQAVDPDAIHPESPAAWDAAEKRRLRKESRRAYHWTYAGSPTNRVA